MAKIVVSENAKYSQLFLLRDKGGMVPLITVHEGAEVLGGGKDHRAVAHSLARIVAGELARRELRAAQNGKPHPF